MTHPTPVSKPTQREHKISVGCALIGTVLEYFDHFIYTYYFLIFLPLFFPTDNPYHAAIVRALAISIGFIVRPLGSFCFARMADIWGRRITLIVTSLITGFATLGIGLLPTYEQIGTTASFAFITFRVVQVLAISGETTTAVFFLYEHAPEGRKACYTSLLNVAAMVAAVVASAACIISMNWFNNEYAWRFTFVTAGVASLVGYGIRHYVKESPVFETVKKEPISVWATLREHSHYLVPHLFSGVMTLSVSYTTSVYLADFYKKVGFSDMEIIARNACVYTFSILIIILGSRIGDRLGNKHVVRFGALWLLLGSIPCLSLLDGAYTASTILFIHLYLAIGWGLVASTVPAPTIALWPPRVTLQIGALIWGSAGFFSAGGMPLLMLCAYEISSSRFLGAYICCVSSIVFFTWHRLPDRSFTPRSKLGHQAHA